MPIAKDGATRQMNVHHIDKGILEVMVGFFMGDIYEGKEVDILVDNTMVIEVLEILAMEETR